MNEKANVLFDYISNQLENYSNYDCRPYNIRYGKGLEVWEKNIVRIYG